jgi:hypothetical protein
MNDRVLNRINSAEKVAACLHKPEHLAIWQNQSPVAFTAKINLAAQKLTEIRKAGGKQELTTTGATADKDREEKELEDIAHTLGGALVACCADLDDLTAAAPFDLSLTQWRVLRDEQLLQKARALEAAIAALIAAQPVKAAEYGLDTLSHSQLNKEGNDFAAFIVAPDTAISSRAALTRSLRPLLADLEQIHSVMDTLILQFKSKPGGPALIAEYEQARFINDRGHGRPPSPAPTAPKPGPQ